MHSYSYRFSSESILIVILVLKCPVLSLFVDLKCMCIVSVVALNSHLKLTIVDVETDIELFAMVIKLIVNLLVSI
jgi:hypothetical protein